MEMLLHRLPKSAVMASIIYRRILLLFTWENFIRFSFILDTYTLFAVRDADLPSQTLFIDQLLPIAKGMHMSYSFVNGSYLLSDFSGYTIGI